MDLKPSLSQFIDKTDLLQDCWNKKHVLFKDEVSTDEFLDEDAVQRLLDSSLLSWPYFTVLLDGVQPERGSITRARAVGEVQVQDVVDGGAVRKRLEGGATLKLSQLEDWHLPTRNVMRDIESRLAAELKAYMFYTPSDKTGMLPHRDGSHVLVVQISGSKEWMLYARPEQIDARSGLDVDADHPSHTLVLEPGDVLYLPHGYPHAATARAGNSLHLTITMTEPTPLDLVEALLATCPSTARRLFEDHYRMRLDSKAEAVVDELRRHLESVESEALIETAVRQMRKRTV
jgi:ribosomal protein L16 Arg81 hydroxylase